MVIMKIPLAAFAMKILSEEDFPFRNLSTGGGGEVRDRNHILIFRRPVEFSSFASLLTMVGPSITAMTSHAL